MVQQPVAGLGAEGLQVQRRPVDKRLGCTHGVDTRQKAANPFQHLKVVQLRRAPAPAGADRKRKTTVVVQGAAVQFQRTHGRHFGGHQLGGKAVFFQDLGVAPAARPVELGHHHAAVLQPHLVDPVFVGAQGQQAAVAKQADAGECIQHSVGGE